MADSVSHREFAMKIVGRRKEGPRTWADFDTLQNTLDDLGGGLRLPSGVYRFRNFEEAQEWTLRWMAKSAEHRRRRTLAESAQP